MTHLQRMEKHPRHESVPGYWVRHERALDGGRANSRGSTVTLEHAMAVMLMGWAEYGDAHRAAYRSGIGEDGVLGPEWAAIGRALLGLLNGDLGRLDGGACDGFLRGALEAEDLSAD